MKGISYWLKLRRKTREASEITCHVSPRIIRNGEIDENGEIRYTSICLFIVSTLKEDDDTIEIRIYKKDDKKKVEFCYHIYELCKEAGYQVTIFNYKNNKKKTFYSSTPTSAGWESEEEDIREVDYDSLIAAIKDLQDEKVKPFVKNGHLGKFYFALIYKMLIEGAFGVGNNYISQDGFADYMCQIGFKAGSGSNLGEHYQNLNGKYPKIIVSKSAYKKRAPLLQIETDEFTRSFVKRYQMKIHETDSSEIGDSQQGN
ncbi:MAG: hypothetical protein IKP91_06415 [Bacteroidaceae bacterium]|nr:hypothetical protein [Bacteroidaceae bacterium]